MIAEAPRLSCTIGAKPAMRHAMAIARSHVRLCRQAKITGVAFFDFKHGQTGVAPNAIELYPILGFHCLTGFLRAYADKPHRGQALTRA